jgi:hypothetical protein
VAARDEDQTAAVIAADAEDSNGAPCFKLRVLSVPSLPWQIIVCNRKNGTKVRRPFLVSVSHLLDIWKETLTDSAKLRPLLKST